MRKKSVGARRPSATVVNQDDEHNATVFDSDDDDHHHQPPHVPKPDYHPPEPEPEPDPDPDPEPVHLFDDNICINCDGSEGALLVCSEMGCPVALHATCIIGSEPKFDASGSFYCPYCWYKRAVNECRQRREKAMVAKEALTSFLDNKPQSAVREPGAPPEAQNMNRAELEVRETGGLKGIERCEIACEEEGKGSATGSFVSETNNLDYDASSMKKRRAKRTVDKKKSLVDRRVGDENEEVSSSGTSRQSNQVTKRSLVTGKRRRLFWTDEEEKTLKKGVLKFAVENQNIPWRKILEFGCGVFHKTRAPSDLKDKWKTMTKQGCK